MYVVHMDICVCVCVCVCVYLCLCARCSCVFAWVFRFAIVQCIHRFGASVVAVFGLSFSFYFQFAFVLYFYIDTQDYVLQVDPVCKCMCAHSVYLSAYTHSLDSKQMFILRFTFVNHLCTYRSLYISKNQTKQTAIRKGIWEQSNQKKKKREMRSIGRTRW